MRLLTGISALTLSLGAIASISSASTINKSTQNTKLFNKNDLSTWGTTQKNTVINDYIKIAKFAAHPPGGTIETWMSFYNTFNALESSFKLVNQNISFLGNKGDHNVIANYNPNFNWHDNIIKIFAEGFTIHVQATKAPILSSITLNIKANL